MTTTLQSLCEHCEAPFDPVPYTLPGFGGTVIELTTTLCNSCAQTKASEEAAAARAARDLRIKPVSSLLPIPGPPEQVDCRLCGNPFEAETAVFQGDKKTKGKTTFATVCDACAEKANAARSAGIPVNPTYEDRRRKQWVGMTGIRYEAFHPEELPVGIRPHVERVLAWQPQPRGIGLVGPSRAGKSPLLYELGQRLFVAGCDVMPTTGLEFQRKFHRAIEHREEWARYLKDCEECAVLLIDDADKLNLTAGVEAEYYGMLEHRRNWQRPVLCTLNLTGEEIAQLGRDRADRASAIVERLRDLCEFLTVS